MTDQLYQQLASTGVVGVFLVLALLSLRSTYNALVAEKNARIEDVQKFNTLCLALQKEVITSISTLAKIAERTEKKEEERDRDARIAAIRTQQTPQHELRPMGGRVRVSHEDETDD
jgi:CTP synthase (UTP-ammonia lyase)